MHDIALNTQNSGIERTNTLKAYYGVLKRYSKTVNDPILTRESIILHLQKLKEAGYSPKTINYDFERLATEYLSKSTDDHNTRKHDLKKIKQLYYTKNLDSDYTTKAINEHEIKLLIDNCNPKLSIIIELLATTGLRISEALNLKYSDIDELNTTEEHIYFNIIGKGRKYRAIFIEVNLLNSIKEIFQSSTYLFITQSGKPFRSNYISREISRVSANIIGRNIHPHTLRHSFITISIANGIPLDALSKWSGHYSPAFTLSKYSHNKITPNMNILSFRRT